MQLKFVANSDLDDCSDEVKYEEEWRRKVKDLDGEDDEDKDGVAREEQAQEDSEQNHTVITVFFLEKSKLEKNKKKTKKQEKKTNKQTNSFTL